MSVANSSMGKDMVGIDFAAHKGKNIANSTLIRTVIRGLLKNGHKKTPQENSYGVWDRKKALILSYQRLFFRRYLILNLTPRSLPPKNIVLPTNSMFSYPEAGNGWVFIFGGARHVKSEQRAASISAREIVSVPSLKLYVNTSLSS